MSILSITHPLNGLLMITLPIGLGFFLTRKFRLEWKIWWMGSLTFILSQFAHLPFNSWILNPLLQDRIMPVLPVSQGVLAAALALGLSAGFFEELARYIIYRWWVKDARSWSKGVLLGAGHGGMEAILLGLLVLITYLQVVAYRNVDLSTVFPADQVQLAEQQIQVYWTMPWYASLLGAVERAFTIPFHIAASVLVLQVFIRKQMRWLWLAVGWHMILDAGAVYASNYLSVYLTEGIIGIGAIINIGIILALRKPEPDITEISTQLVPTKPNVIQPVDETPENLSETRYL